MQYRNTKTGALIETACQVSGENWVEVKPQVDEETSETKETSTEKSDKKAKSSKDDAQ